VASVVAYLNDLPFLQADLQLDYEVLSWYRKIRRFFLATTGETSPLGPRSCNVFADELHSRKLSAGVSRGACFVKSIVDSTTVAVLLYWEILFLAS
jgi:hypothetical protein